MRDLVVVLFVTGCGRIGYDTVIDDARVDALARCPPDTTALVDGSTVCIELRERGNLPWGAARDACTTAGRRLCADAEWALACTSDVSGALIDMANDGGGVNPEWEWMAEEAAGIAQKRGFAACTDISTHAVGDPYDFRCCLDR
ncbi:MAG: hypothetical protein NT062_32395 [Proteobacteria bacterium]|nr:hypothetical protein [Pseudomonadota bacterium]